MPSAPEDTTLGTSLASRRRMTRSGTCKGTYTRPAVIVKQKADRVGDAKAVIGRDAIVSRRGGSSPVRSWRSIGRCPYTQTRRDWSRLDGWWPSPTPSLSGVGSSASLGLDWRRSPTLWANMPPVTHSDRHDP
jgi:hypothetical protein